MVEPAVTFCLAACGLSPPFSLLTPSLFPEGGSLTPVRDSPCTPRLRSVSSYGNIRAVTTARNLNKSLQNLSLTEESKSPEAGCSSRVVMGHLLGPFVRWAPTPPAYLDVSRSPGSLPGVVSDCPAAPLGTPSPKPPAPFPSPVPGSPAPPAGQEMGWVCANCPLSRRRRCPASRRLSGLLPREPEHKQQRQQHPGQPRE